MKLTAFDALFPPEPAVIIDPEKGTIARPSGVNLMRALWNRTGQGSGIIPSVALGIVATGASSLTSFGLTDDWNEVDTVPANSGVQIPQLQAGQGFCIIFNGGANTLRIYPIVGVTIDALGAAIPYQLAPNKMQLFSQWSISKLRSAQLG